MGLALMEDPNKRVFIYTVEQCKWIELAPSDMIAYAHLSNFSTSVFYWQMVRDLPALPDVARRLLRALQNLIAGFFILQIIFPCIQILA